jgi:hypothetical protein
MAVLLALTPVACGEGADPACPSGPPTASPDHPTRVDQLWIVVEQARHDTGCADATSVAERAVAILAKQPPEQIIAVYQALVDVLAASYRVDLWAAAYLIGGGASDDGFEYFRGWLIMQGRATFERAVDDPDSLALLRHPGGECEQALYIGWDAYKAATGRGLPDDIERADYPDLEAFWDFDDPAEMRRRLPKLSERFL